MKNNKRIAAFSLGVMILCCSGCHSVSAPPEPPDEELADPSTASTFNSSDFVPDESERDYYEWLCFDFDLPTYDTVYYPEKRRHYVGMEDIYHDDWFCEDLDRDNEELWVTSDTDILYSPCPKCAPCPDFYALDEEAGIYHKDKKCLNLGRLHGTPMVKTLYRFVSPASAEANYTPCEKCFG